MLFVTFIAAMGVLYAVLPKNDFSETEKRYLAGAPSFSFKNLSSGKFTADFEGFLADQTPFRKFFVSVNAYFEYLKGNNGTNGVYLGSDGWLIEKPFDRSNKFDKNMERIREFCEKSGIPAAITAVPSKGYIYSEKLPKNALAYLDGEYREKLENCGMHYIDLFDAMEKAKNEKQLFYRTDHHWTSAGAYLAYTQICRALGLKAVPESGFEAEETPGFFGTSYSTSCYTLTKPDTLTVMRSKKSGGAAEVIIREEKEETFDNMFFTDALAQGDKYVVFLDGNHPMVTVKTGNEGGRLLLIKDSFAHCLAPFLAEHYSEIVMIDLRYYRKPISDLMAEKDFTQLLFVYGMDNLAESSDIILR